MSRYTAMLPNGREIAWGFDPPLSEYFLTEYPTESEYAKWEENGDGDDAPEVVFSIMSHTTTDPHPDKPEKMHYSNDELLELMLKLNHI